MKLVALTYGTEGDTRPIAALCRALMQAGHEPMLLADGETLGSARAHGVPHAALSGNIRGELGALLAAGKGVNATAAGLARIANAHAQSWTQQAVEAARGCDALLISGLASFVGLSVAECLRIPVIGTGLIPISPTRAFASPFLPPDKVPAVFNRASHHLVNALLWRAFRKATNQARHRVLALPRRRAMWAGHPMLYGVSPSLLPQPRDWPSNAHLCGQWLAPAPAWSPPSALRTFLEAGEAPIYLGFGSMVGFDRDTVLRAMIEAVDGRRALLFPGWAGVPDWALPGNVFVVGETPHDWLFPRASVVIHHGGSGTSHSACRAGVPSVVLPFAGDQPFWADRLYRLAVADRALSAKRLDAASLGRALAHAQRDETRQRARELGQRMAEEDGTTMAVSRIEAAVSMAGGL